jgi:phosphosulfolactate phosphohydrolase-like enzyme|tara:strand:+ start:292 stop:525 length:234 start_codon:yes stop_codon:yes gene_type:complete
MEIEPPWGIGDNDIHSRSIKAWAERQLRTAAIKANSAYRIANEDILNAKYIAAQVEETHMYNAIYDISSEQVLDIVV